MGAGRKAALGGCLASSPQPAWPHPTLLVLLSHPGFISWLGPRLPPACPGFQDYKQPARIPHLGPTLRGHLGGGARPADRSTNNISSPYRVQPGNYEKEQSEEAVPGHLQQPTTQPEKPVTSLHQLIPLEDGDAKEAGFSDLYQLHWLPLHKVQVA